MSCQSIYFGLSFLCSICCVIKGVHPASCSHVGPEGEDKGE